MKSAYKPLIASILILLGILFRTVFHLGENVEFVTSAALLAGSYLGLGWAVSVPIVTMIISDFIIGNTTIFLFTWSAYAVIGVAGYMMLKYQISNIRYQIFTQSIQRIAKATFMGIGAAFWFYLWTNFGVWLLDSWGMYPKTFLGLLQSYAMGVPFLKLNLLGNMMLVPLSFGLVEVARSTVLSTLHTKSVEKENLPV